MGLRKLGNLITHLPPQSALHREVDPHGSEWTLSEHMLAALVELTDAQRLDFIRANSKKGTKLPIPLRVPRPGEPERAPKATYRSAAEGLKALFDASADVR